MIRIFSAMLYIFVTALMYIIVARWGLVRDCTLHDANLAFKSSYLNDDFFEEVEYQGGVLRSITPTSGYRPWQIMHQGVDFLAQWTEHWIFTQVASVRIPSMTATFFLCALYNFVTAFMS